MGVDRERDWFDKYASEVQDPELTIEVDGRVLSTEDLDNAFDEEAAREDRLGLKKPPDGGRNRPDRG